MIANLDTVIPFSRTTVISREILLLGLNRMRAMITMINSWQEFPDIIIETMIAYVVSIWHIEL